MNREEVIEAIEEADTALADEYLHAAIERKRELCPDWDIAYVALSPEAGREATKLMWEYIRKGMVKRGG